MTERSRVSGHYAGAASRLAAFALDGVIVSFVYGLMLGGISFAVNLVFDTAIDLEANRGALVVGGFLLWTFLYGAFSLALAGRTPGKAIVGLRVVTREGAPITSRQAVVRTLVFPVSAAAFGLGYLGILIGKERRALHDLAAGTSVVYDWGDRPAELPTPLSRWLERRGASEDGGPVGSSANSVPSKP